MVRRKRKPSKPATEHLVQEPFKGKQSLGGRLHMQDTPENIERMRKSGESAAKKLGLNLKSVRSSGKTAVSMSGISQKQWNSIFKKKKKGK